MSRPIYTVTTVRGALGAGCRCVGYYYEFVDADEAVTNNACDIYEMGYYPYAVIEKVEPGLYTFPRTELWYRWNHELERYEPCPKPERFLKSCGWGIG